MNLQKMIEAIRSHPDFHKAGMVLSHNGVVRSTSRNGRAVSGIEISINREKFAEIIDNSKKRDGIVDVLVEIAEENTFLPVGSDVMMLVVAGDIRENVIETLRTTLDAIKTTVTAKKEYFI